jgi:protein-tyrosine phosphatase
MSYSLLNNGIFIGNLQAVISSTTYSRDILEEKNIQVVISALTEEEYEENMIGQEDFPNSEWYRLVIDDDPKENIHQYFYKVHTIISNAVLNRKNVIVHCAAGMSRSPTLVLAYLMIENNWSFEEAYQHIKRKRPEICPNIGFIMQLKQLEYQLKNNP